MMDNLKDEMVMVLVERFGVDRESITLESLLREDLDLDSIDLFDIVGLIEKKTGVNVHVSDFVHAKTFGDFLSTLESLLSKASAA